MGARGSEELAAQTRETHVLMNNCYRDFAVRNASELGGPARTSTSRSSILGA